MPAKYPHVVRAEAYAKGVIEGKIVACKWVRLACQRHFDDKDKSKSRAYKYKFDRAKAERICLFAEKLPHTKGKWARRLIVLEPWQCFVLAVIFGWVHKASGLRRFRRADIMVPRKNGKSIIAAVIGLYMLVADNESGAEVYSGATTEAQAKEVFTPAQVMVQLSQDLRAHYGVLAGARAIAQLKTNSSFKTLIGKPGDGASPHCHIADEYHEHQTDEQVDTMQTGMGARAQPLQLIITTAGDNIAGPCFMEFEDAKKVLEGTMTHDDLFAIIFTIDDDDDWQSETALKKANPNYGVSVDDGFLLAQQAQAMRVARKQGVFKTKHLNMWVGALESYFDMQKWKACEDTSLSLDNYLGFPCKLGLDLASRVDLAALEILFRLGERDYVRFGKYYLPRETVDLPENEHYRTWESEGWLTVTEGATIDFDVIVNDIVNDLAKKFDIVEIAFDPTQATYLSTKLMDEDIEMVEYRQNTLGLSEPMKELDAIIIDQCIRHNGDPVAAWSMSNVVAKANAKEEVFPRKTQNKNKIDPTVALIMALGRMILAPPPPPPSYTAQHGVIVV